MFFQTTHDDDPEQILIRWKNMVERMSENQDDLYYVVADDYRQRRRAARTSISSGSAESRCSISRIPWMPCCRWA